MTATPFQALTASDTPMDGMTHQQRRPMADTSSVGTTELETRDRAIVERVATGLSLRAVGAEFSVSHTVVRKIAARAGVHSSGHRRGPPPWPAHRLAELRRLRSEGLSMGGDRAAARREQDNGAQADQPTWHADAGNPHEEEERQRKRTRSPQPCHCGAGRSRRLAQQGGRRVRHHPPTGQPDKCSPYVAPDGICDR